MNAPWIEVEKVQQQGTLTGPGSSEYAWQALFACQVQVLPHPDWIKLKWGFNASALFDETLDRQRLFLESQYGTRPETGVEAPNCRTLAFRFINRPGEGLSLVILGKIQAKTESDAREDALSYFGEVKSTFPYDYTLLPAQSKQEFLQISGGDILEGTYGQLDLAQVKRIEVPLYPERTAPFLQGLWRSSPRAHEQIWRSLAASPSPLLMNLSLRCTVLYEKERERLLKSAEEVSGAHDRKINPKTFSSLQQWHSAYVERRLIPWEKFFYLQIHLASTRKLGESLFRTIGTSLTLNSGGEGSLPGYQVVAPGQGKVQAWQKNLRTLDLPLSGSYLPISRLSEVADLQEVFAVMRLPYSPPEDGFPDVKFITSGDPPEVVQPPGQAQDDSEPIKADD